MKLGKEEISPAPRVIAQLLLGAGKAARSTAVRQPPRCRKVQPESRAPRGTAPFCHTYLIQQPQKRGRVARHTSHLAGKGGEPAGGEGLLMAPGSRQALGAHPFLFPAWQTLPLTPASWGLSPASTSAPPAAAPASCQTPPKQGEEANGVALVKGDRTAMAHGCPAPPCVLLGPPLPTLLEPAVATWATAAPARRAPSIARAAHPAPSSSRAERRSLHDTQHPKATCLVPSLVTFIICVTITTCLNTSPFFFFPFL